MIMSIIEYKFEESEGCPWTHRAVTCRTGGAPSYPDTMDGSMHAEQAALVALLQRRPEGMRWPEITAEVLEIGSALEVWHRLVPATLIGAPGQPDALSQRLKIWTAGPSIFRRAGRRSTAIGTPVSSAPPSMRKKWMLRLAGSALRRPREEAVTVRSVPDPCSVKIGSQTAPRIGHRPKGATVIDQRVKL